MFFRQEQTGYSNVRQRLDNQPLEGFVIAIDLIMTKALVGLSR